MGVRSISACCDDISRRAVSRFAASRTSPPISKLPPFHERKRPALGGIVSWKLTFRNARLSRRDRCAPSSSPDPLAYSLSAQSSIASVRDTLDWDPDLPARVPDVSTRGPIKTRRPVPSPTCLPRGVSSSGNS